MLKPAFQRPGSGVILEAWHRELQSLGYSNRVRWVFRENLALTGPSEPGGEFGIVFQTESPSVTQEDVAAIYTRHIEEPEIVLQLLVAARDFSLCTLLFDSYEVEEDRPREELGVYFDIEPYRHFREVFSPGKLRQSKALSGLDFVPLFREL